MTKTKLFMPLLVILVMGMATSAFAQLNCAVASGTISRATKTGHAEQAGDISFTCVAASASAVGAATVTVQYPVIITNTTLWTTAATGIRITDTTGSFAGAGAPIIAAVVNTAGGGTSQVVLSVPAQVAGGNGTFTLRGVLVSLVGATATSNLQANVSVSPPASAGANILINSGDNTPTVITSIMDGIDVSTGNAPALTTGTAPALFLGSGANVVPTRAGFSITLKENYIDMFRTVFNNTSIGATNATQLTYNFSGMAAGSTIGPCVPTLSPNPGAAITMATVPASGVTVAAGAGGTSSITVNFTGIATADSPNQAALETLILTCGTSAATVGASVPSFSAAGVAAAALPITAPITATVTLAPTGSALSGTNTPLVTVATGGSVPRYATNNLPLGTVISFTPATTTLLIPYAVVTKDSQNFDTGFAIANTTVDPASFNSAALGGATDQSGTITFTFFPQDGVTPPSTFTTPNVLAGGSYIATLSNMLPLSTPPVTGAFSGYVFAVANFTNGHGAAFVFGGTSATRLTSTTDVLVLASPLIQPRSTSPAGFPLVEYTTK